MRHDQNVLVDFRGSRATVLSLLLYFWRRLKSVRHDTAVTRVQATAYLCKAGVALHQPLEK